MGDEISTGGRFAKCLASSRGIKAGPVPPPEPQGEAILRHLRQGHTLTALEALQRFGCFRLAARVNDLRAAGYDILAETETSNGKRYASYRMAGK